LIVNRNQIFVAKRNCNKISGQDGS
jgi:hypothetical protein